MRLVQEVAEFPVIWFTLLTSLSSVLLHPLQLPGFIVDLCGGSTGGKTTTLLFAASLCGDPFRKAVDPTWHEWDCTQVFVERLATILRSLPVMLDETRLAKQGLRILFVGNLSEERFEVGVVPARLLSFGAEASR